MVLNNFYRYFLGELAQLYDANEAAAIALMMFEERSGFTKHSIITKPDMTLESNLQQQLTEDLARLTTGEPVQYVLGYTWFSGQRFSVSPAVLIPRPETEELVQEATETIQKKSFKTLLDVGTGSGCIPISIKLQVSKTIITAIDISKDALQIAEKNAHDLSAAVNFIELNFLDECSWHTLGNFDVIVSNPPYIPAAEASSLHQNVTGYEPHLALFVEDHSPFIFYEKIARFSLSHLNPGGSVLMETHADFAKEVQSIFARYGYEAIIKKDIFEKDRIVLATQCL